MSTATAIRATADFREGIRVPLEDALHASVHILGRSGLEACKHAVILMAQSARKVTKRAPKRRRVERGANGVDYIEILKQPPKRPTTIWLPDAKTRPALRERMIAHYAPIGRSGLAASSWFWGGAGRPSGGEPTEGAVRERTTQFGMLPDGNGWELVNKLGYILATLPQGWDRDVERKASARIMHEVARKVFPAWTEQMRAEKAAARAGRRQPINRKLMQLKAA